MWLGALLAVLTALSNAASNVLQRLANRDEPVGQRLSAHAVGSLVRRKVWLAGFGAVVLAWLLQAAALDVSELTLVQPIVVLELPLTLIGASWLTQEPLQRREWGSVMALALGLAVVTACLAPHGGRSEGPANTTWAAGTALSVAVVALLMAAAKHRVGGARAGLLGAATGVGFGLTAALTKGALDAWSHGLGSLFTSWTTYAMAMAGLGSLLLTQSTLRAGPLVAAQPGMTLLDPLTATLWGVLAFGERIDSGPRLLVAAAAAGLMVAATVTLSRSALLVEDGRPAGRI